jgi:hypothetical protein
MKRKFRFSLIILFGLAPVLLIAQNSSNNRNVVKMGVSQINITPDEPVIMSGYDAEKLHQKVCMIHYLHLPYFFQENKKRF